ncbi:penicillin-binding protein 2 [Lentzea tibetensis]|uniref:Penicillin-binding protein 2 n=1 Tax=Lentzea tibetensis TaxID=2591470 RepID=A0A563EYX6_9PSEU|nr:penicillin-binding protein 2 [Lentzea tibetensis]TWP52823.1 penicillin-binding protein 2 [Lentzea tibetensis]
MNTPLRRVGLAMMAMILLLLGNATWVQVINADDYRKDSRNRRVLLDEYSRKRGMIIASEGTTIANVQETTDRLRFLRTYANGAVYAPVTGYFSVTYGTGGLERTENDLLNGSDDRLFARRVSALITGRDPEGGSVQLSIVPKVQEVAYQQLAQKGFKGAVVAMDPKTGAILAMASTPSYDPNPLASHDGAEQTAAWENYNAKSAGNPMFNRATGSTEPPGSTFKLVVTAAALADGKTKDDQFTGERQITLPQTNTTLENFNNTPCGDGVKTSLENALAKSCNTAFAELAGQLGKDKLRKQAEKFGIGEKGETIPLPVAASDVGPMADLPSVYQTGLGQRDVRMTPLQNAVVAATIANGGTRMKPYLVDKILGPGLEPIDEADPDEVEDAMDKKDADTLRDMMILSEQNTGGEGRIQGLQIASKTGTAEHGENPQQTNPHAWYVAFAPANDPKIAIAVLVEDGGDRGLGATGGKVAAPIGRAVMGAYLAGR